MLYRVIGLMSGSSLDGLDIALVQLHDNAGKWDFQILQADCFAYPAHWVEKLRSATTLSALEYQLLHAEYGHYLGKQVNQFINIHQLNYQVQLISSHGHTSFHLPGKLMTAQLGDGASIAAETGIPVVSDLRSLDVALGGQGAPIVPIGEKLLLSEYDLFLNLGGIANISVQSSGSESRSQHLPSQGKKDAASRFIAFDVCPANRVLNLLAAREGKECDEEGAMASGGTILEPVLKKLNELEYYSRHYPKSLANEFGTNTIFPILAADGIHTADALRTYTEHISQQLKQALEMVFKESGSQSGEKKLLVTGGGAFNTFLVNRIRHSLRELNIDVILPDEKLIQFKEALVMGLIGVLRWREENNVLASVTGASRDSIGGAVWMGLEA